MPLVPFSSIWWSLALFFQGCWPWGCLSGLRLFAFLGCQWRWIWMVPSLESLNVSKLNRFGPNWSSRLISSLTALRLDWWAEPLKPLIYEVQFQYLPIDSSWVLNPFFQLKVLSFLNGLRGKMTHPHLRPQAGWQRRTCSSFLEVLLAPWAWLIVASPITTSQNLPPKVLDPSFFQRYSLARFYLGCFADLAATSCSSNWSRRTFLVSCNPCSSSPNWLRWTCRSSMAYLHVLLGTRCSVGCSLDAG